MNNCILMAEVVQDPQLRFTADNNLAVAEMVVQFAGLRDDDPPATLKVVGWGNLAQEIQEKYHVGDRVILEGRLNMSSVDRPEGFKEKRAELTVQRVHLLGSDTVLSSSSTEIGTGAPTPQPTPTVPTSAPAAAKPAPKAARPAESTPPPAYSSAKSTPTPADYDDIPF